MRTVFADTSYYVALTNPDDEYAGAACEHTGGFGGLLLTTAWVLTEVANHLRHVPNRPLLLSLVADLRDDPRVTIIPPSPGLFDRGLALFAERPDKEWSLTDCISFVVMREQGLSEALTSDHHFEQAGFVALLR